MGRHLVRVITLLLTVASFLLADSVAEQSADARTSDARADAGSAKTQRSLLVVSANVREGSRVVRPADLRDGDDRRAFARRVLNRGVGVPDVVLLQEAVGTATAFARTLNRHPRADRLKARYVVAVPPSNRIGHFAGQRRPILRDGAVLVNKRTVARVPDRGFVRTWGRWHAAPGVRRMAGVEQAWVRIKLRNGAPGRRQALVANLHPAPRGMVLKTRAIKRVVDAVTRQHRRTPRAIVVVGGDLNLTRCQGPPRAPERRHCAIRNAHQKLLDDGFRDVVRSDRVSAVTGVRRRIDFVYTRDRVVAGSWDRCYLAYHTTRPGCSAKAAGFPRQPVFVACQARAERFGDAGGRCSPRMYGRYYSDHPVVRARIAWT